MSLAQRELTLLSVVVTFNLLISFGFQGTRGLWEPDEGQCVSTAAEMLDSGEFIIPQLHHRPNLEKPPMMYWGMIAGIKLLGRNAWGARAFFGLCHFITTLIVGGIGFEFRGRRAGFIASLIYTTMLFPAVGCNIARPDIVLTLATTICLYCFWKSVSSRSYIVLWKMLLCASFGFGFMCKGPAVLVLAAPMFIYLLIMNTAVRYFLSIWSLVGFLLFLIIGLSWYIYVAKAIPGAAAEFWDNQAWGRLISSKYKRHPKIVDGILIYGLPMIWGTLPWSLVGLWTLIKRRGKVIEVMHWEGLKQRSEILLLILWVSIPLFILLLASSKLPLYLLPTFPAIAVLITLGFELEPSELSLCTVLPSGIVWGSIGMGFVILFGKYEFGQVPVARNSAELWDELKGHLPLGCDTIIPVDEHLDGLGFYSRKRIVATTTAAHPYPTFSTPFPIDDEFKIIADSHLSCAIITYRSNYAVHIQSIRSSLSKAGISYEEIPLRYHRLLIICNSH